MYENIIKWRYKETNNLRGTLYFILAHIDNKLNLNKLNNYFKVESRKKLPHMHTDVVHKIECKDCDAPYLGQTGILKARIRA